MTVIKAIIDRSQLPRYLRSLAREIKAEGDDWRSVACEMAADEIELLERIIIHDPVELPIEEGDRANG